MRFILAGPGPRLSLLLMVLLAMVGCKESGRSDFELWLAKPDGFQKVVDVLKDPDTILSTRVAALSTLIEEGLVADKQKEIEEAISWCPNPGDVALRTADSLSGLLGDEVGPKERAVAEGLLMLSNLVGAAKGARIKAEVAQWVFAPLDNTSGAVETKAAIEERIDPLRIGALGGEGVPYYLALVKRGVEFQKFTMTSMVRVVVGTSDALQQRRFIGGLMQGDAYSKAVVAIAEVLSDQGVATVAKVRLVGLMSLVGWGAQIRTVLRRVPDSEKLASTVSGELLKDLGSPDRETSLAARDALFAMLALLPPEDLARTREKLSAWAFQDVDTSKGPEETWKQLQVRIRPAQIVFLGDAAVPVVMMMLERRTEGPEFTVATMLSFLRDFGSTEVMDATLDSYLTGVREALAGPLADDPQVRENLAKALAGEFAMLERFASSKAVMVLAQLALEEGLSDEAGARAVETGLKMLEAGELAGDRKKAIDLLTVALVRVLATLDGEAQALLSAMANQLMRAAIVLDDAALLSALEELFSTENAALITRLMGVDAPPPFAVPAGLTNALWSPAVARAQQTLLASERELDPFGVEGFSQLDLDNYYEALDQNGFERLESWTNSDFTFVKVMGVLGTRFLATKKCLARVEALKGDPTDLSYLLGEGATLGSLASTSAQVISFAHTHPDLFLPMADSRLKERLDVRYEGKTSPRLLLLDGPYTGVEVAAGQVAKELADMEEHIRTERAALVGVIRAARRTVETLCFQQAKNHPDGSDPEVMAEYIQKSATGCKSSVEKALGKEAIELASLDDSFFLRATAMGVARWQHLNEYRLKRIVRSFIKHTVDQLATDGTLQRRMDSVTSWSLQDQTLRPVLDLVVTTALAKARDEWRLSGGESGLSDAEISTALSWTTPPHSYAKGAILASVYLLDGFKQSAGPGGAIRTAPYLEALGALLAPDGPLLGDKEIRSFLEARGGDAWFILREIDLNGEPDVAKNWLLDDAERTATRNLLSLLRKAIAKPVDDAVREAIFSPVVAKELLDHYPFMDLMLDAMFESSAVQGLLQRPPAP